MPELIRIGVLSDTHNSRAALQRAMAALGELDVVLHLGDCVCDADFLALMYDVEVYNVRGNCDFTADVPDKLELELGTRRIFLTHGHIHHVDYGNRELVTLAKEQGYDITLYGHTHYPELDAIGKQVFMNPGSALRPRGFAHPTAGYIELRDGEIFPKLVRCDA